MMRRSLPRLPKSNFSASQLWTVRRSAGQVRLQPRDDVAVEFNRVQVRQAVEQGSGQRAEAGADFDHGFARLRMHGVDDGVDDAVVDEEVLAEAFAGGVHEGER